MAKFSKVQVITAMTETGMVPVFYHKDIEVAKEVAKYLDIPFFSFDYIEEYEQKVLNYMYE